MKNANKPPKTPFYNGEESGEVIPDHFSTSLTTVE